jgi:hypothetical protein
LIKSKIRTKATIIYRKVIKLRLQITFRLDFNEIDKMEGLTRSHEILIFYQVPKIIKIIVFL